MNPTTFFSSLASAFSSNNVAVWSFVTFATVAYSLFVLDAVQDIVSSLYSAAGSSDTAFVKIHLSSLVSASVGMVAGGISADVIGRKTSWMIAAFLGMLGGLGSSLSFAINGDPSSIFGQLLFWRALAGIGLGSFYPIVATSCTESVTKSARGRILVIVFLSQGVGRLMASLVPWLAVLIFEENLQIAWRLPLLFSVLPFAASFWWSWRSFGESALFRAAMQQTAVNGAMGTTAMTVAKEPEAAPAGAPLPISPSFSSAPVTTTTGWEAEADWATQRFLSSAFSKAYHHQYSASVSSRVTDDPQPLLSTAVAAGEGAFEGAFEGDQREAAEAEQEKTMKRLLRKMQAGQDDANVNTNATANATTSYDSHTARSRAVSSAMTTTAAATAATIKQSLLLTTAAGQSVDLTTLVAAAAVGGSGSGSGTAKTSANNSAAMSRAASSLGLASIAAAPPGLLPVAASAETKVPSAAALTAIVTVAAANPPSAVLSSTPTTTTSSWNNTRFWDAWPKTKEEAGKRAMTALRSLAGFRKSLLVTATSWFLLDVFLYGPALYTSSVLTIISASGSSSVDSDLPASTSTSSSPSSPASAAPSLSDTAMLLRSRALGAAVIAAIALPGYLAAIFFIEGSRKQLQQTGFFLCAIAFFLLGTGDRELQRSYQGIPFLLMFGLCFCFSNAGPNSTTFVVSAEAFPTRIRATAHGLSAAAGKLGAVVGSLMIPGIVEHYASQAEEASATNSSGSEGEDGTGGGAIPLDPVADGRHRGITIALFACAGVAAAGALLTRFAGIETSKRDLSKLDTSGAAAGAAGAAGGAAGGAGGGAGAGDNGERGQDGDGNEDYDGDSGSGSFSGGSDVDDDDDDERYNGDDDDEGAHAPDFSFEDGFDDELEEGELPEDHHHQHQHQQQHHHHHRGTLLHAHPHAHPHLQQHSYYSYEAEEEGQEEGGGGVAVAGGPGFASVMGAEVDDDEAGIDTFGAADDVAIDGTAAARQRNHHHQGHLHPHHQQQHHNHHPARQSTHQHQHQYSSSHQQLRPPPSSRSPPHPSSSSSQLREEDEADSDRE